MHREIQIKQFPIVTTHWWPKTRNERFVWENEQYLYRFYLLYTTMSKWSECAHTSGVWRRRQRLTEGVSEAWCWRNFSSANGGVSQSDRLMQIPNPVHATPEKYVIGCCNYDVGLGHISNDMIMRISSVKPVPWLAVNFHHLFSNGAAVNTQSRRSLTSYAISSSLSQINRLR